MNRPILGLSGDGRLYWMEDSSFKELEFNKIYEGYYEPLHFTALECFPEGFAATGVAEDGLPYVYRSLMGGVWEPVNLLSYQPIGANRVYGEIRKMLYDPKIRQVILLSGLGEVVLLPDCPKCVKIIQAADQAVIDGWLEGDQLVIQLADGNCKNVWLDSSKQLRISVSYAVEQLQEGGWLVNLCDRGSIDKTVFDGAFLEMSAQHLSLAMEVVEEWLTRKSKEEHIVFYCDFGSKADEMAGYCRKQGFEKAYSLGGTKFLMHVK